MKLLLVEAVTESIAIHINAIIHIVADAIGVCIYRAHSVAHRGYEVVWAAVDISNRYGEGVVQRQYFYTDGEHIGWKALGVCSEAQFKTVRTVEVSMGEVGPFYFQLLGAQFLSLNQRQCAMCWIAMREHGRVDSVWIGDDRAEVQSSVFIPGVGGSRNNTGGAVISGYYANHQGYLDFMVVHVHHAEYHAVLIG